MHMSVRRPVVLVAPMDAIVIYDVRGTYGHICVLCIKSVEEMCVRDISHIGSQPLGLLRGQRADTVDGREKRENQTEKKIRNYIGSTNQYGFIHRSY